MHIQKIRNFQLEQDAIVVYYEEYRRCRVQYYRLKVKYPVCFLVSYVLLISTHVVVSKKVT